MKYRQSLFWDTKPKNIDPIKHKRYIIARVLEFGKDGEVRELVREYDPEDIKSVVATSRELKPETKNLWELILKK